MTSFGGRDLQERHPMSIRDRALYVPIYPSRAHPDNGMLLYLAGNQRLSNSATSYVTLQPRTIKAALLKAQKRKCQLSAQSLKEVIKHIGFRSPWPSASHVRQPFISPQPAHNPWAEHNYRRPPSAISYTPTYQRPFEWDSGRSQWTYIYGQTLSSQMVHRPVRSHTYENQATGWELLKLLLVLAVVILIILDETKYF
jgi:hypothetical protein